MWWADWRVITTIGFTCRLHAIARVASWAAVLAHLPCCSWNAGKKFMGNVDAFLKSLLNFDKDNVPGGHTPLSMQTGPQPAVCRAGITAHTNQPATAALRPAVQCVDRVERDYISNPNFRADLIRTKSSAAAGLCAWVINICKYFRIYQVSRPHLQMCSSFGVATLVPSRNPMHMLPRHRPGGVASLTPAYMRLGALHQLHLCMRNPPQVVAPKRAALAEANKRLEGANKKLSGIRAKVKELQDRVAGLEESLMRATEDKNNAMAQVLHRIAFAGQPSHCSASCAIPLPSSRAACCSSILSAWTPLLRFGQCQPPVSCLPAGGAHGQQGGAGTTPHHRAGGRVHAVDRKH